MAKSKRLRAIDPNTGWRLYYPNRPTVLYYIKFTHKRKTYYKIGITTQTIQKRFAGESLPYEVIWYKQFKSGRTAYIKEQRILERYDEFRYWGPEILRSGNSELFTKDILQKGAL